MTTRYYLDAIHQPEGTTWFTLVFEDTTNYFVERFNDSTLSFLTGRVKKIRPSDFRDHFVNNIPLAEVVEAKLREIDKAAYRFQV